MLVFRILHKKYGEPLFTPGLEGRWNSAGKKVLYCSESIPLAFMESMIRRQGVGFNNDFQIAHIEIPDTLSIKVIYADNLEKGWDNAHDYSKCQPLADSWYNLREDPVLKVPSATLSICYNYVLNSQHPDFGKVKLVNLTPLIPDSRIDEMLRKAKQNE
ncbi:MAG: RES domain-containing protein [Sphingobacteriaceae bacterium]|nr:MAG: RES domain-containing protein [Sphingobacteriaceae bacterium]